MNKRVRAILIENGMISLIKREKSGQTYYVFPGGSVESGESLEQALRREIREELGIEIAIQKLFLEREFERNSIKQDEYFYLCKMTGGVLGTGNGPEYQIGNNYEGTHKVVQFPLFEIKNMDVFPLEVRDMILQNHTYE